MSDQTSDHLPDQLPGQLPGQLLMWVLIISELVVFGAGLIAFMGVRMTDPVGFAYAELAQACAGLALA